MQRDEGYVCGRVLYVSHNCFFHSPPTVQLSLSKFITTEIMELSSLVCNAVRNVERAEEWSRRPTVGIDPMIQCERRERVTILHQTAAGRVLVQLSVRF